MRKSQFCKHHSKNFSGKIHQRMLNLEGAGLTKDQNINMIEYQHHKLPTNYKRKKIVTIQWTNWTTSYPREQNEHYQQGAKGHYVSLDVTFGGHISHSMSAHTV